MKKSDFMAARLKIHEREPWVVSETRRVAADVEAAEAAGVAWDPEGPPELPAHLIVVKTGQNIGRLAYTAVNNAIGELTLEELDEVKRRCDAWPELEELLQQPELRDWPGRHLLKTVLRGGWQ